MESKPRQRFGGSFELIPSLKPNLCPYQQFSREKRKVSTRLETYGRIPRQDHFQLTRIGGGYIRDTLDSSCSKSFDGLLANSVKLSEGYR